MKPDSREYRPSGRHAKQGGGSASARNDVRSAPNPDRRETRPWPRPRFSTAMRPCAARAEYTRHVQNRDPQSLAPRSGGRTVCLIQTGRFRHPPQRSGFFHPLVRTPRASNSDSRSTAHASTRPESSTHVLTRPDQESETMSASRQSRGLNRPISSSGQREGMPSRGSARCRLRRLLPRASARARETPVCHRSGRARLATIASVVTSGLLITVRARWWRGVRLVRAASRRSLNASSIEI